MWKTVSASWGPLPASVDRLRSARVGPTGTMPPEHAVTVSTSWAMNHGTQTLSGGGIATSYEDCSLFYAAIRHGMQQGAPSRNLSRVCRHVYSVAAALQTRPDQQAWLVPGLSGNSDEK